MTASFHSFSFESFGVLVRIESNRQDIVTEAKKVAKKALLNLVRPTTSQKMDHVFELRLDQDGTYRMLQNGSEIGIGMGKESMLYYFNSMVRLAVAEYAVGRVFLHAGAVAWKGKAIVFPADSHEGKTTLTAELVRNGAVYYSDDYAVIDEKGFLHPFPRALDIRTGPGPVRQEVTAEMLGGISGDSPIPIGLVLLTGYRPDAKWKPKILTAGNGVLKMIPFTIPMNYKPDFAMRVLNNIASRAIILSSYRDSAEVFAKTLLNFVDKNVN